MAQSIVQRSSGILLHPTSLPGPYGIGDLGPTAHSWLKTLADSGQTWWQFLPLGPPAEEDAPYKCFSAFAGNPALISPESLFEDGLLEQTAVTPCDFPSDHVDYRRVVPWKEQLLAAAWDRFKGGSAAKLRTEFEQFCDEKKSWLDDFALFMAVREAHRNASWLKWPRGLRFRLAGAMNESRRVLDDCVGRHRFVQFLFFRQLTALRKAAQSLGVRFIGDLPIFVSLDSADVWAHPNLFLLDSRRRPQKVSGVPPDYFSRTGQLWGNPLYDWRAMQRNNFDWWISRFRSDLAQADIVRIDHFRGLAGFWSVPAHHLTARHGRWMKGPGSALFDAVQREIGGMPFIAEDLGHITPDVERLRDDWELPGMKILQFAFGASPENPFLPHHYQRNTVVYTGTHDNDTTRSWYDSLPARQAVFLCQYAECTPDRAVRGLIRLALSSVADRAIFPMQDVLNLGSEGA